ncbi:MAG TPA: ribbon-helix-helix protein, CopG family [Thermoanaerobacterales bacterium]|nr:ribbon-helix-helix protein, CopG family [Thermoanaerobacterales bacterium]
MAETKSIMINLPDNLLEEVDFLASMEKKNRSQFIEEVMKLYIQERSKQQLNEEMKKGYIEMGSINKAMAELVLEDEFNLLRTYESHLAERE